MKDYTPGLLENGGKMRILFTLIDESIQIGDKILVFSQSLLTLNLMEELLSKRDIPGAEEKWTKNKNYFSKYSELCLIRHPEIKIFLYELAEVSN